MKWYIFAILSSMIWGVHYTILGHSLTKISPYTLLLITSVSVFGLYFLNYQTVNADIRQIFEMRPTEKLPILLLFFTSLTASLCLYKAISAKNAANAALIEITYPIWIIIFSIFLFKMKVSFASILGGILILLGSGIIILFS